jgi:peptidoglycan/xylan/chitin deacetylase (PgdA/CDA1 family)
LSSGLGRPHEDVYDTFDLIMDQSESAGLRSAFNFLSQTSPAGLNGNYSTEAPEIRRLLRRVHERGHEIGLHTSYESGDDPSLVTSEAERLARICSEEGIELGGWGGRQHYLRFRTPGTWQGWDDAGMAYDSTLGFHDAVGFRCGTCYEYPVFDVERRRQLRLRERPLIVMEMATLDRSARSADACVAEIRGLAERCRLFGGDFTLLWHNNRLLSRVERQAFERVLG